MQCDPDIAKCKGLVKCVCYNGGCYIGVLSIHFTITGLKILSFYRDIRYIGVCYIKVPLYHLLVDF